ncbi:MAG: hypothetical protein LBL04_01945 [Bacteroidales bacterium]|jgi:hypothetical protein|nr:hypothetical protein [Bacteroidales bacterium]
MKPASFLYMMRSRVIPFLMAITVIPRLLHGQDVEAVIKAPPLTANGGIAFSQIVQAADRGKAQSPYSYYLTGNLNFNFFGAANVPLSFAFSNQQFSGRASLPFNRFSIAPSCKWIKAYAGYASLQFSPYTLAGHEIFGGGAELSPPGRFKFTAIYGRLKKAIYGQEGEPAYRRMGGGFKAEYADEHFDAGVNIFKAKDISDPSVFLNPDSITVLPQDNLSGSVYLNVRLAGKVRYGAEYGVSAMNRDMRGSKGNALFDNSGDVSVYHAMRHNITCTLSAGAVGASYERVAPNYATLGAYYMLSDFENITANFSTVIKDVNIAVDGGYQHDNLKNQKSAATSRMIFSGSVSTAIGQKWNLGANVSNVQSYMHIRDIYRQLSQTNEFQNLDTLEYTQVNLTSSANVAYLLQNTEQQRQSISAGFMYQRAAEQQEYTAYRGNNIYNGSLVYQFSHIPAKWSVSAFVNYNHNLTPDMYTGTASYSLSAQKSFTEKLQGAFAATYSNMSGNGENMANVLNVRITGGYALLKKHNFSLSAAAVRTGSKTQKNVQYSINLAYGYSFGMTVARKDKKVAVSGSF